MNKLDPRDKRAFDLIKEGHRIHKLKIKIAEGSIPRPKRNELCICGSDKKYKRCCSE